MYFSDDCNIRAIRQVTRSFDVFYDLRLNKRLSTQSRRRWFETPSRALIMASLLCCEAFPVQNIDIGDQQSKGICRAFPTRSAHFLDFTIPPVVGLYVIWLMSIAFSGYKISWVTKLLVTSPGQAMIGEWHLHTKTQALQWRHNWRDSFSNHQPYDCLLNRLFRRRSKKTSKLRVIGLCAENSPGTGEFPAQRPVTRKMFPFDDVIMP